MLMFHIHQAQAILSILTLKAWEDCSYFGHKFACVSPFLFEMFIVSEFPKAIHECLISLASVHTDIVQKLNYVFEQSLLEQIPVSDSLWSHKA